MEDILRDYGIKPRDKSAPMGTSRSVNSTTSTFSFNFSTAGGFTNSNSIKSSSSFNGVDDIFAAAANQNRNTYRSSSCDFNAAFDDVFSWPTQSKSSNTTMASNDIFQSFPSFCETLVSFIDAPRYDDDIFGRVQRVKSSHTVEYDDVFIAVAGSAASTGGNPFDDLLGGFSVKKPVAKVLSPPPAKGESVFDDLLPGFGSTEPAEPRYSKSSNTTMAYNDIFHSFPSSAKPLSALYDVPRYDDDIFGGVQRVKSSHSVEHNDVFSAVAGPAASTQGNSFDDLLGEFSAKEPVAKVRSPPPPAKGESAFDDLLPGFGSTEPAELLYSKSSNTTMAYNDIFQSFPSSAKPLSPLYDVLWYDDDIFGGVQRVKSSHSVEYDDVLSAVAGPAASTQGNSFDDLLGEFSAKEPVAKVRSPPPPAKGESAFDDLLPGFGSTEPAEPLYSKSSNTTMAYNDIFQSFPSAKPLSPLYDVLRYDDDIFGGVQRVKSSHSVEYDDVFSAVAGPAASTQGNSFDDLLGGFSAKEPVANVRSPYPPANGELAFDDLLPGFGGTEPTEPRGKAKSKLQQPTGSSLKPTNDPFVVLKAGSFSSSASSATFHDPLEEFSMPSESASMNERKGFANGTIGIDDIFDGFPKSIPSASSPTNSSLKPTNDPFEVLEADSFSSNASSATFHDPLEEFCMPIESASMNDKKGFANGTIGIDDIFDGFPNQFSQHHFSLIISEKTKAF